MEQYLLSFVSKSSIPAKTHKGTWTNQSSNHSMLFKDGEGKHLESIL